MPAAHSRRCALPGRELSTSTTTRAGLRSARRAPADRERIRISNVLAAQGRAPPATNGELGTATCTSSSRLGRKRAAGTSPPATVTKAPRTSSKATKTARSCQRSGTSRPSGPSAAARRAQQHRSRVEAAAAAFEANVQAEIAQDAMPPPPPRPPTARSAGPPPAPVSSTARSAGPPPSPAQGISTPNQLYMRLDPCYGGNRNCGME